MVKLNGCGISCGDPDRDSLVTFAFTPIEKRIEQEVPDGPAPGMGMNEEGVEFGHSRWNTVCRVIRLSSRYESEDVEVFIFCQQDHPAAENSIKVELGSKRRMGPIEVQ
jgi:hypothetical protein